jgi:hypothetical protein
LDAKLGTPFNAEEASLKGTVELPFYWASGKPAAELLREIAQESLGSVGPLAPPKK